MSNEINGGPFPTVAAALRQRRDDSRDRIALKFEDRTWTFGAQFDAAAQRANLLLKHHDPGRPFHVGVLMDNTPEFLFVEYGCALARAALIGLNPTRTGEFLARDIAYSDCELIIVEPRYARQLQEAMESDGSIRARIWLTDSEDTEAERSFPHWEHLRDALLTVPVSDPALEVEASDLLVLIFTSGTTKAPKGVLNSQGRLMMTGFGACLTMCHCTSADTVYCAMPLFHANAQILAVATALTSGACLALARRFSKSGFLPDVRRFSATLFNYVGTPFAYIMDTPAQPDDADNTLRLAYGNEAPRQYIEAFAERFGCQVVDGYGASEVGVGFSRAAGDPAKALGRSADVKILNEAGTECAVAQLDATGHLLNPDAAVGEIVNTGGVLMFEGYYKDPDSTAERTRGGWFRTGDLGYRDSEGFIYFAGRDAEWIRVGGENFLARPIEEALSRFDGVMLASVYGVPDPEAGDQVMATLKMQSAVPFDPVALAHFVDGPAQLPLRWRPRFVRIADQLAVTHTNKVLKRQLRREKFLIDRLDDPIYWRPTKDGAYQRLMVAELATMRKRFEAAGNLHRWEE